MPSNRGRGLLSASTMALVGTWCTPGLTDEAATPQGQAQSRQALSVVLSFNNISQIAVLKGSQGAFFGRNATGGLIQITTRDPSHAFNGLADVAVGNHNTYGTNFYVTFETQGAANDPD